jgi:predicted NAD/FAD-binding protein
MKIAIIGSGIAGLGSAYYLNNKHEISVFEAENYFGGHTNTIDVQIDNINYAIDTGFIVYNETNYPYFTQLLKDLKLKTKATDMSFGFECKKSNFVYNGGSISGLLCDPGNLFKLKFYQFIFDLVKFKKQGQEFLKTQDFKTTAQEFLIKNNYSNSFKNNYLLPISAALWSSSCAKIEEAPIYFILEFLNNHNLLDHTKKQSWRVLENGSSSYVKALLNLLKTKNITFKKETKIVKIIRENNKIVLTDHLNASYIFDKVIIAAHSNQALAMLATPTEDEKNILSAIKYQKNEVILHTDNSLMPRNKKAWASWNYRTIEENNLTDFPTVTYYMNKLQSISSDQDFFVSLNQTYKINPKKIIKIFNYEHPIYDTSGYSAQKTLHKINGVNNIYYAGAYFGFGFHEDGLKSAVKACALLEKNDA